MRSSAGDLASRRCGRSAPPLCPVLVVGGSYDCSGASGTRHEALVVREFRFLVCYVCEPKGPKGRAIGRLARGFGGWSLRLIFAFVLPSALALLRCPVCRSRRLRSAIRHPAIPSRLIRFSRAGAPRPAALGRTRWLLA